MPNHDIKIDRARRILAARKVHIGPVTWDRVWAGIPDTLIARLSAADLADVYQVHERGFALGLGWDAKA